MYKIIITGQAAKDAERLSRAGLSDKAKNFVRIVRQNPFQSPPPYEALKGDRRGAYSRRINRQHRFVYEVLPNTENLKDEDGMPYEGIVKIIRMWTHYE